MQYPKSVKQSKIENIDTLIIENAYAKAEISLFGGQVLSFVPKKDNRNRFWLSQKAVFDKTLPIRGGIPICWPWFSGNHGQGDVKLPSHGFLRTQDWVLVLSNELEECTQILLKPNNVNAIGFNYQVEVILEILIGETLVINLTTKNLDTQEIRINCAFHSYFSVSDVENVELKGINGEYLDKLHSGSRFSTPAPYRFSAETDRIHLCTTKQVEIVDGQVITSIGSDGHDSLVVWNPWQQTSENIKDMNAAGFKTMLCVETASTQWTELQPGQSHTLTQLIA